MNDGKRASREVVHEALGLLRLFDLKAASEPQAAGEMVARCIRIAQAETAGATVGDVLRVMTEQPEPMAAELRGRAIANLERVSKPGEPGEQVDRVGQRHADPAVRGPHAGPPERHVAHLGGQSAGPAVVDAGPLGQRRAEPPVVAFQGPAERLGHGFVADAQYPVLDRRDVGRAHRAQLLVEQLR